MPIINTTSVTINLTEAGCASCQNLIQTINDEVTTSHTAPVSVDMTTNDVIPDGRTLTIDAFGQPTHGTLVQNADGTLTYTPDGIFIGTMNVSVSLKDENGTLYHEILTIHVGQNIDDSVHTPIDTTVESDVTFNDTSIENYQDYTISSVDIVNYNNGDVGTATINAGGGSNGLDSVQFAPPTGYSGPVTINVTFSNGAGDTYTSVLLVMVGCEDCKSDDRIYSRRRGDNDIDGTQVYSSSLTREYILQDMCGMNVSRDVSQYEFTFEDGVRDNVKDVTQEFDGNTFKYSFRVDDVYATMEDLAILAKFTMNIKVKFCDNVILNYEFGEKVKQNIRLQLEDDWLVTEVNSTAYVIAKNNTVSNVALTLKSFEVTHGTTNLQVGSDYATTNLLYTPEQDFTGNAEVSIVWQDQAGMEYPEVYHFEVGCGGVTTSTDDILYDVDFYPSSPLWIPDNDMNEYVLEARLFSTNVPRKFGNLRVQYNHFTYSIERTQASDLPSSVLFQNVQNESCEVYEGPSGQPYVRLKGTPISAIGGTPSLVNGQERGEHFSISYKITCTPCNGAEDVVISAGIRALSDNFYQTSEMTYTLKVGESITIDDIFTQDSYGYATFRIVSVVQASNGHIVKMSDTSVKYTSLGSFVGTEEVLVNVSTLPSGGIQTKKLKFVVTEN